MNSFKLRVLAQVLPFLLIAPAMTSAQTPSNRPPSRSEAAAAMKAGQHQAGTQYTRQQIDQLIAPIALYPDQPLAQVLMAATYPKQLIEAADWLQDPTHAGLKGDALVQALADLPWDPSVKALAAFPQIVAMMTEHIEWTESLGLAFAMQQAQIMNRVQALRQLAVNSGRINNIRHVMVRRQADAIEIVSAEPDRVFVPMYNPTVVYGSWPDPGNPPVYLAPPRRFASETVETVDSGIDVFSYPVVQPLWGWARPDWRDQRVTIETEAYTRITPNVQPPANNFWRHEGPIAIIAPSAAPPPPSVAPPAGTVAPAQAAAVGMLRGQAASHSYKVRIENSAAAPSAVTQQPGTLLGAQRNREASAGGQPPAGGAAPVASGAQTQTVQPEKTKAQQAGQAQQPSPEKPRPQQAQAPQPQAEKGQAPQFSPERMQAGQSERARAPHPQAHMPQAQHSQAEWVQAEHPQAERRHAQQHQAVARPPAQIAQPQVHVPAPAAAPGGPALSHAGLAARQAQGSGSSTPPRPPAPPVAAVHQPPHPAIVAPPAAHPAAAAPQPPHPAVVAPQPAHQPAAVHQPPHPAADPKAKKKEH